MRAWIRYILQTPDAMKAGPAALEALHRQMMDDFMSVMNLVPPAYARTMDLKAVFMEWTSGFPGVIGHRLTDDVERMNGLPVTPFIAETLTRFLAELQARGLREQSAA